MSDAPTGSSIELPDTPLPHVRDAVDLRREGDRWQATIEPGHDVFGNAHGGYVAAIVAEAMRAEAAAPDVLSLTVHFLRKPVEGPLHLAVTEQARSRRFASLHAVAEQDGRPVVQAIATVGDLTTVEGPTWTDAAPWTPTRDELLPPDAEVPGPNISATYGQRFSRDSVGFANGTVTERAEIRSVLPLTEPDELDAIVACDVTPPAAWNALGMSGWVPTLELTMHVRRRPGPGPLSVVATSHHVHDGLLEEDATVRDAQGHLVVQSRQLALWTAIG